MPVYEIIYETGNHSLAEYENDTEAAKALTEHHNRAVNGLSAVPESSPRTDLTPGELAATGQQTWNAERVKKVLVYDAHPATLNEDQTLTADELLAALPDVVKSLSDDNGVVRLPELESRIRSLSDPRNPTKSHAHDSNYKMEESRQLEPTLWGGSK